MYFALSGVNVRRLVGPRKEITMGRCEIKIVDANGGGLKPLFNSNQEGAVARINPFMSDDIGSWLVYTTPGSVIITVKRGQGLATVRDTVSLSAHAIVNDVGPKAAPAYEPTAAERANGAIPREAFEGMIPEYIGQDYFNSSTKKFWKAYGYNLGQWVEMDHRLIPDD